MSDEQGSGANPGGSPPSCFSNDPGQPPPTPCTIEIPSGPLTPGNGGGGAPVGPTAWKSFRDGFVLGDFSDDTSWWRVAGQVVAGIAPYYGQLGDARDTIAAMKKVWDGKDGAWADLGMAGIGWVPLAGDFAKGVLRVGRKSVDAGAEVAEQTLKHGAGVAPAVVKQADGAGAGVVKSAGAAATGAVKASKRLFVRMPIPPAMKARFDDLFKSRQAAIARRDALETQQEAGKLSPSGAAELTAARSELNTASQRMGELAGEAFAFGHFKDVERIFPPPHVKNPVSRAYEFDQVYKAKDPATGMEVFVVVEAKGPKAGLSTRNIGDRDFQQGTPKYFDATVKSMKYGGDAGARAAGQALSDARISGDVRYFEARATVTGKGQTTGLGDVKVHEFDISGGK